MLTRKAWTCRSVWTIGIRTASDLTRPSRKVSVGLIGLYLAGEQLQLSRLLWLRRSRDFWCWARCSGGRAQQLHDLLVHLLGYVGCALAGRAGRNRASIRPGAVQYGIVGAGRRYLVFLLCTRGRLPWRLGAFLNWGYDAGLLRVSGVAYQFRHRELQDWLTTHPTPA